MGALALDSTTAQLSELLELVCVQLQLTDTQHEEATTSYGGVANWLADPKSPLAMFNPDIFPQGSMSLLTTVKPRKREEFDIDLVCLLQRDRHLVSPVTVFNDVLNRIREHDSYKAMTTVDPRCIILEYRGQYRLEIIPAVPAPEDGPTALVIPDREQREWVKSDPKGYNRWFAAKAVRMTAERRFAATVEPLPANVPSMQKTTLQRAVQLFKRRRDVHFDGSENPPRSIVLTTIDADLYQHEESLFDAVINLLARIEQRAREDSGIPVVPCPTNPSENLAEDWEKDRDRYREFLEYIAVFQDRMLRLQQERSIERIAAILNELFDPTGNGVVNEAVKNYTARYAQARTGGGIGMTKTTSALTTSAPALVIPKNSFFGE